MSAKLGEILVRENLVTPQQLREALDYQRASGGRLGSNLVKLGMISDLASHQFPEADIKLVELLKSRPEFWT